MPDLPKTFKVVNFLVFRLLHFQSTFFRKTDDLDSTKLKTKLTLSFKLTLVDTFSYSEKHIFKTI